MTDLLGLGTMKVHAESLKHIETINMSKSTT